LGWKTLKKGSATIRPRLNLIYFISFYFFVFKHQIWNILRRLESGWTASYGGHLGASLVNQNGKVGVTPRAFNYIYQAWARSVNKIL